MKKLDKFLRWTYDLARKDFVLLCARRTADFLEKFAVGSGLIGVFEKEPNPGIYVGLGCYLVSLLLTIITGKRSAR